MGRSLLLSRRQRASGFTLVELMVAVTAGLFVSIAVFALAKHASAFYQRESRVGDATMAAILGFNRLRADIARAGFLSTPNVRQDPSVCGGPQTAAGWPDRLQRLASVAIEPSDPGDVPQIIMDNGLQPERLVLAGAYTTTDRFTTRDVVQAAGTIQVFLAMATPVMVRLGLAVPQPLGTQPPAIATPQQADLLPELFPPQRALRIVDSSGRDQYGTITGVVPGDNPQVILDANSPPIVFNTGSGQNCGLQGNVKGPVNVVNIIRYRIGDFRQEQDSVPYQPLYEAAGAAPFDEQRTDLIREELDGEGVPIPGTQEVVAEYAVNLQFGITTILPGSLLAGTGPELWTFEAGAQEIEDYAGNTLNPNVRPQLIRSVRARLSVRSREADRQGDVLTGPGTGVEPGFYRMRLAPEDATGAAPFARVRTLQADIALRNQQGVTW